jgi:hypothetical protein
MSSNHFPLGFITEQRLHRGLATPAESHNKLFLNLACASMQRQPTLFSEDGPPVTPLAAARCFRAGYFHQARIERRQ